MNTKQLRQKILDLAIRGKLVPQDSNDEPASKLLERIRAEKEQLIKNKKMKRDKNESYIFVGDDKLHYEKFADGSIVCIEDEIPFEIPENWAWCRLSEIIKLISGQDLQSNQYNDEGKGFLYITGASCIENEKLKKNRWTEYPKSISIKNDILISCKGSIGTIAINTEDKVHIARQIMAIRTNSYCYNLFIKILIKNIIPVIQSKSKGVIPGIERKDILDSLVAIPPLSEQKRIAETVETLLELVDSIESDKIDLSELIKKTKAKVLDLVIKGKLVPQDPNDEPADKLLEKIREEKEKLIKEGKLKRDKNETYIFKNSDDNSYYEQIDGETVCINDDLPFEIPQSWRWCKVDNVTTIKGGKRLPSGQSLLNDKTNHPYLRIVDMKNNTIIDDDIHYISEDVFAKIKQYIITDEDLYITIAGTIGNVGIIPSKYNNANLTENAVRVTPLLINKKYLMYLILSNYVHNQFIDKTHHVAMPKLAIERIKGVFVPIPPLFEQSNIINKLESIFSYLDNIESIIKGS